MVWSTSAKVRFLSPCQFNSPHKSSIKEIHPRKYLNMIQPTFSICVHRAGAHTQTSLLSQRQEHQCCSNGKNMCYIAMLDACACHVCCASLRDCVDIGPIFSFKLLALLADVEDKPDVKPANCFHFLPSLNCSLVVRFDSIISVYHILETIINCDSSVYSTRDP